MSASQFFHWLCTSKDRPRWKVCLAICSFCSDHFLMYVLLCCRIIYDRLNSPFHEEPNDLENNDWYGAFYLVSFCKCLFICPNKLVVQSLISWKCQLGIMTCVIRHTDAFCNLNQTQQGAHIMESSEWHAFCFSCDPRQ